MAKFKLNGYNSYSGVDAVVTARINSIHSSVQNLKEKTYVLSSLQTISVSTHQDKRPVRVIGSVNSLDYVMGQRTVAGSLVFTVFDKHFATEMFEDLQKATGKTFRMVDEMPGLDLTISFANEYGRKSRMAIYGVKFVNEGQVISINDLFTENTFQFVATSLEPLRKDVSSGTSEGVNKNKVITSSSSNNNHSNNIHKGEDIYNKGLSLYKASNSIKLSVSTQQPTLYNQEGIAVFDLSPKQKTGFITIYNSKTDKVIKNIAVNSNRTRYSVYLPSSQYKAWYQHDNNRLSNTVNFTINKVLKKAISYNDIPVIENVTHKKIKAMSNNISHDTGVCVDLSNSKIRESKIVSRDFSFDNLDSSKSYMIYTKNNNEISKATITKTLDFENMNLNLFKTYVSNNRNLLSEDFSKYLPILDKLKDDNFLNELSKNNNKEAKELMFLAIKYKNEFTTIINENCDAMPVKKNDSVYGNEFKFNTSVSKANIFFNKNNKDYFESSQVYPTEINYIGKNNTLYNTVGINDGFIKSPKYVFYSYADNDKQNIKNLFGKINVLNNIDVTPSINKLTNEELLCLTAKEYKERDINLLKAPNGHIDENNNLIINLNYRDVLGNNNDKYLLCIAKLEECLDRTPFRKVEVSLNADSVIIDKVLTAINKENIYAIWIEDNSFNVVSKLGFVSATNKIENVHSVMLKDEVTSILRKIEYNINKQGYLSDISSVLNYDEINEKDLYLELAKALIANKELMAFELLYELFKIQFENICINKERFKTVKYNKQNKSINYEDVKNANIVQIKISKDNVIIDVIEENSVNIDTNYAYNVFYLVSSNPSIKSGFVIVNNDNGMAKSYNIEMEVI